MSLSAGEWLGGEDTIHILNQNDLGKWAGQGTAKEKWGIRWKHINLSPSNLGCHNFQTPFKRAGPLLSTPFSWVIGKLQFARWIGNFSQTHITTHSLKYLLGFCITKCSAKQSIHGQLSHLCPLRLCSSARGDALVIQKSRSYYTENPTKSINPIAFAAWPMTREIAISGRSHPNSRHSYPKPREQGDLTYTFPRSQPCNTSRAHMGEAALPGSLPIACLLNCMAPGMKNKDENRAVATF